MENDLPLNCAGDAMPDDYREAIEACRPARFDPEENDWRLPEVAPLADEILQNPQWRRLRSRVAQVDAAIAGAMEQTPVPDGLAERLLERLQPAAAEKSRGTLETAPTDASVQQSESVLAFPVARPRPERRFAGRRRWLTAATAAAAAVMLAFAGWWGLRPAGSLSYDQLVAQANAFDHSWTPGSWKSLRKSPPRAWYSMSAVVPSRSAVGWQEVNGFLGRTGVVYDLASVTGAKGALYVVPLSTVGAKTIAGLGTTPGSTHHTAGRTVSAWTDGTRLFVLVVRGGERDFRSLIEHSVA